MREIIAAKLREALDVCIDDGGGRIDVDGLASVICDAIAMEARQGRDGETRLDPKDDSAGRNGIAQTPSASPKGS